MVRIAGIIACLMLLGGAAHAQEAGTGAPPAPEAEETVAAPANAVSVEPVARDEQIERRIREIMQATGWYENPGVEVDDGVVFLDGVVKRDEHRIWARDLAQKTQDVVAVVNRVQVEQEIQSSFAPAVREFRSIWNSFILALPNIILALVILPLAWWAAKWVSRGVRVLLRGRIDSPFLADVISRAIAVPVFLIGLYIVLQVAGLTRLAISFLGGAGVIGIVIGFAFRDIAENFLASLILSVRRPFKGGDFIDVAGQQGIVQSMNTRSTILLSAEGNHIQIPNATIFKNTIVNYSAAPPRRSVLDIGVGYDVSTATAQGVVQDVLGQHEAVMNTPEPLVLVDTLGASTVNLKVYYWIDGHRYSVVKVKSALLRLIKKALTEAGISMPDEAREVIFPQGVPVVQLEGQAQRTAQAMAESDIEETARAEREAVESEETATVSEGDLSNERHDIETQTAVAGTIEGNTDLLEEDGRKA